MLTLFFTFLSLLKPLPAGADYQFQTEAPRAPIEGQFEVKAEFDYLSTSSNFPASGGSSTTFPGGGAFTNMSGVGQVQYDWNKYVRVYGGFAGGESQANVIDPVSNSTSIVTTATNATGVSEFWAGGQYWWRTREFDVVPEVDFVYPAFRVDPNGNNPLLGEGAMRFQGGSWFMYHMGKITPFAYGDYAYRDEGRSGLFDFRVGVRYRVPHSWWIQGEFRGEETLVNDTNTANRTLREGYLTHVDGGSFEYDSINPGHGEVAASVGTQIGDFGIYVGGSIAAYGHSSADDWTAIAGVTFTGRLNTSTMPSNDRDETYFNTRPEKYDSSLFEENAVPAAPPPPDDVPEIMDAPPPPPPVKKKRKVQPKSEAPMPSVELLMKDTEKQLDPKSK